MVVYFVTALQNSTHAIDLAVLREFPTSSYKVEPGKWFVSAQAATGKELSILLGIRETQSHLILPVRGYNGRAQPDLWEWLSAETAKASA
jgi:hypothetical protein